MENYLGTLRIFKPSTLQKWKDKGWYKDLTDRGYIYAVPSIMPDLGLFFIYILIALT